MSLKTVVIAATVDIEKIVIENDCHSDRSAAAKPQAQWRNLLFPVPVNRWPPARCR